MAGDYTDYVNPFVGTSPTDGLLGNTFPGPTMPFGFVQLSPDTREAPSWECCPGYHYLDSRIYGFSHTRLSGTGVADLIDVLLLPNTNAKESFPTSAFNHNDENASPGYYRVKLADSGVEAELSATTHCGIHRYTYPKGVEQALFIDLDHSSKKGDWDRHVIQAQLKVVSPTVIEGYRLITGWAKLRKVYFRMELSRPLADAEGLLKNGSWIRENLRLVPSDEPLVIKVGLSAVSPEGARKNMKAEATSWNFDHYVQQADATWDKTLSVMEVEGNEQTKRTFYTALYHSLVQPNVMSDVDGHYIATNFSEQVMPAGQKYYSTFSIWDTYRAIHPLYNIICPERNVDFISSMLTHYDCYGYLPIWDLWGQDNYCMIGNHAIPILVDAVMKNLPGLDAERIYEACKTSSLRSHTNSPFEVWEKYGYMPEDKQSQSVSITLEMAFDDWCVARLARHLGKTEDAARFEKRAQFYRNIWNEEHRFFWGKNADGNWLSPFEPLRYGANGGNPFTEGNAWQWRWYVPHDIEGLVTMMGGKKATADALDKFFTLTASEGEKNSNASGFVGQYIQGNEPDHHAPYLYNYCDQPAKTQAMLHHIMKEFYNDTPSGISGNDDCGEMSAWYVFSALGFYPVNPCSDVYSIGTPEIDRAVLHLPSGKDFTVVAHRKNADQHLIKRMTLNGKAKKDYTLNYSDIINGGTLEFWMK